MFTIRNVLLFTIAFILCVPIVTLSHEYGHIIVAEYLGYDTKLFFDKMTYDMSILNEPISEYMALQNEGIALTEKQEYDLLELKNVRRSHMLWITIGGVLQTILVGTLGFIFLWFRRYRHRSIGLEFTDWLAVFLALFWSRQLFNPIMGIISEILDPNGIWFGGDEYKIARLIDFSDGSIAIPLAAIGLYVCASVSFYIVPQRFRFGFIVSAILGTAIGYYLWMNQLGPTLLPFVQ